MRRLILISLILLTTPALARNGFYQIGYGTQSKGMGGVAVALPQDTLVAATNPAGMIWLGNRLDIGGDWLYLDGSTTSTDSSPPSFNGHFRSSRSVGFPEFGLNWMYSSCTSFGLSIYLKGVIDVRYNRPLIGDDETPERARIKQYFFTPSWSMRPHCDHTFGVALNIALTTLSFGGLDTIPPRSVTPENVTGRGEETIWGLGLTFGWMGQFFDRVRAGLAYQTRTFNQHADKYRGLLPDGGQFTDPSMVIGGIGLILTPYLLFGFDLGWIFWSDVEAFGNNANSSNLFGARGGPLFGWRDSLVAKLGLSYAIDDCLTVRIGYNFGRSPITSEDIPTNSITLATEEHHLTLGATWGWCRWWASIAYIHGFANNVTGDFPEELGNGRRRLRGQQDQISASLGICY